MVPSNDALHKRRLLAAGALVMVALSACTAGYRGQQTLAPHAGFSDTGDGVMDTGEPSGAGNAVTLTGRAKYEGTAAGEYSSGGLTAAMRYFSATVSLIADFRDNSIGGIVSEGRDTATDERIFAGLRLEPATILAGDTSSFGDGVIGVVDGNLFTGTWSGRFTGGEASYAGSRNSVGGTFHAERLDDASASITGIFSGDYSGYTSRTVGAFNDLSPALRSRLARGIAAAAESDVVATTDAGGMGGSDTGGLAWNTGVTQSSDNLLDPYAPARMNWAINARYDDDGDLVFDRTNLVSAPRVTLTTSGEPEAPGYRNAVSVAGWLDWAGVEHLEVDASTNRNYSILVTDLEDNDDPDYMVGGVWTSVPGLDNRSEAGPLPFTAAAGGNDPFHGANIETLKGRATYQGDAFGLYASRRPALAFQYFSAEVRLTADFNDDSVHGVVLDGRDTASDEILFAGLELIDAGIRTDGPAWFRGLLRGVVNGGYMFGVWGGQFLGNGASAEAPGSVAGTFGASSDYSGDSLVGIFGAYENLTRRLSGHGIEAGTFTVEPGDSAAHGNLVLSCPADGAACAVTVRADGSVFRDRNGGDPEFVFALPDAPSVELDGVVRVGADVAPPAGQLAAGGTRHGASVSSGSVRDGVGRARVVSYLRDHVRTGWAGLKTFAGRPVVRLAEGTSAEFTEYTERAVQLINAALPYEKRVLLSTNPAPARTVVEDVPDGEIHIDFTPWADWNSPARGSGGLWWNPRDAGRYDDEARRQEVLERRAAHIWIDSERMLTAFVLDPVTGRWETTVLESHVDDSDTIVKWFSGDQVVRMVASMLLHGLGLVTGVNATSFPDSILNFTDVRQRPVHLPDGGSILINERVYIPGHILYPVDRETLLAAYGWLRPGTLPEALSPESLGTWSDTSFHIRGELDSEGGQISFGVASRNGLAQPWASGSAPSSNLADNAALSGTVTWNGALLGIARSGETVAGAARLAVDLATLDGQLDFTGLEQWSAGAVPGEAGTGTAWGDGGLGFSVGIEGNTFRETGGDHGEVTGSFFGTSHEAMGGVVERNDLAASFGGKR